MNGTGNFNTYISGKGGRLREKSLQKKEEGEE